MFIYYFIRLKHTLVNGEIFIFQLIIDKLEPRQAFSFDGNVSHSCKHWLKRFDFYLLQQKKIPMVIKQRLPFFSHALVKNEEKYMRLLPFNLVMK